MTRLAIIGGGPSGLFLYKRLLESGETDLEIDIFERKSYLGAGMPYSHEGAGDEHVTNVSDNEIPEIVLSVADWVKTVPVQTLERFGIDREHFNAYKVLPRLFFGQYLSAQFDLLLEKANALGIVTRVHLQSVVADITDEPEKGQVRVDVADQGHYVFDRAVICTGHRWPARYEGKVPGYFDSPYPPSKLKLKLDHAVAIRGSSLTAIDAIRTLARNNGRFSKNADGQLTFEKAETSANFRIVMHSRNGLLPALRFHLDDSHLSGGAVLTEDELAAHRAANDGFLSLDYIFEQDFKRNIRDKDPEFYARIRDLSIEDFVAEMMELRERLDPFVLLKAEYAEAAKSIKRKESVYWKEMLAVLSFALNYPAKYLSAEDMLRLQKTLQPLISIVIAFIPQSSCEELFALHEAGALDIVAVGHDSRVEPGPEAGATIHFTGESEESRAEHYHTFVDCIGQPHLNFRDFPFPGMRTSKTISPARLRYRSGDTGKNELERGEREVDCDFDGTYYLHVPGVTINDNYQVVDHFGAYNPRLWIMAVPYIGGYNPDYSGLDFCEAASARIVKSLFS